MTKKEQQILDKIQEAIVIECSIQCQKCKKIKSDYNMDDYYFAEKLIHEGWTFKRDRILCEKCAFKIKKRRSTPSPLHLCQTTK